MGLGKTAATLALHLINPAKTPSEGVVLDEKEWGPIAGKQVRSMLPVLNWTHRLFVLCGSTGWRNTAPWFDNAYFQVSDDTVRRIFVTLSTKLSRDPPFLTLSHLHSLVSSTLPVQLEETASGIHAISACGHRHAPAY